MDNSDIIHQDLLKQSQNESSMKPTLKKPKNTPDVISSEQSPLREDLSGSDSGTEEKPLIINNLIDASI